MLELYNIFIQIYNYLSDPTNKDEGLDYFGAFIENYLGYWWAESPQYCKNEIVEIYEYITEMMGIKIRPELWEKIKVGILDYCKNINKLVKPNETYDERKKVMDSLYQKYLYKNRYDYIIGYKFLYLLYLAA